MINTGTDTFIGITDKKKNTKLSSQINKYMQKK